MKAAKLIKVLIGSLVAVIALAGIFWSGILTASYLEQRNHWEVRTSSQTFTESDKKLSNPNRGFYNIYGFVISDEKQNYRKAVVEKMGNDEYALSMVQINLRNYMDGCITEEGLENIEKLFAALQKENKQYIVRFLYDWGGMEGKKEPDDIQIILTHMEQMEDVLDKYSQIIFTFQGIFVGPCAEMHSSAYLDKESMQKLMQQFLESTPDDTFLSVRTPQQWRTLTGIYETEEFASTVLSSRLGLFNDGIMGTSLDTGTYGTQSKQEAGMYEKWTREEELDFQDELCKLVPNGGEVIIENPVNDFENAVESLKRMHVTYLNRAYDQNVLNKWASFVVTEEGCFNGMDGLSYVEHHLGYRLLIENAYLEYDFWPDELSVAVDLKNVGFAPLYKEPKAYFIVKQKNTEVAVWYPIGTELRSLSGGMESEHLSVVAKKISLAGLEAGEYEVFFLLHDVDSDAAIELANEQEMCEYGYFIGSFSVEEIKNPFTGEKLDLGGKLGEFFSNIEKEGEES